MQKFAICVVGKSGTGKTVVSQYLATKLNAKLVVVGDIVEQQLKVRDGTTLIGSKRLANALLKQIKNQEIVIIDGIRESYLLNLVKKQFPHCLTIAIAAFPSVCHERLSKRGLNRQQIVEKQKKEKKIGVQQVFKMADRTFINDGKLLSLKQQVLSEVNTWLKTTKKRNAKKELSNSQKEKS